MPKMQRRMQRQSMKRSQADLPTADELSALLDEKGRLAVRVTPGARSELLSIDDGRIAVKVRAKPQDGAANEAVRRLIALALSIPPSRVALLRGATSREKQFQISD